MVNIETGQFLLCCVWPNILPLVYSVICGAFLSSWSLCFLGRMIYLSNHCSKNCVSPSMRHTHTHILYAFSSLVCAQSAWQRLRAILQLGGTQVSDLTLEIALMLPLKHYCSLGTVSPHTGFYSINKTTANFAFDAFYSYLCKSIMITQIREREETSIISLDYVVYWNSFDPHFLHI